jgi:two-component system cell cycle response regulator PopA
MQSRTRAIALDAPPALLRAQLAGWRSVAVAEEERARRLATAMELGVAAPTPLGPRALNTLYIGAPSAAFLPLDHFFNANGGPLSAAFSSFAGLDRLHDDVFDAVVINGAVDTPAALSWCAALRRNASLLHLPTLFLTAAKDDATAAAAIERGASAVATGVEMASLGWLLEAVRRDRRRRGAEHELHGLRDRMGDARTGLWFSNAFDAHLRRLADDHHASGRPLSLVALRVLTAHGAAALSPDIWRKGFGEIASLTARLMRAADSGAALGSDLIVVALPASPLSDAKRTAERIAAVAECTAFAAGDMGGAPLIFEQSAVELQPGESGRGMLARALRAIDVESIPA